MVQSADPFYAFFNGGGNVVSIKKTLTTPVINVDGLPLPSGKPSGFCGGVGAVCISSSFHSTEVKTNDAITIKLVSSGSGQLKVFATSEVEFLEGLEVYEAH